jgi:hypothetical protein
MYGVTGSGNLANNIFIVHLTDFSLLTVWKGPSVAATAGPPDMLRALNIIQIRG